MHVKQTIDYSLFIDWEKFTERGRVKHPRGRVGHPRGRVEH